MIRLEHISVGFGQRTILNGLDARIEEGCILDFLRCAAAFLLFRQQRFLWEEPHE